MLLKFADLVSMVGIIIAALAASVSVFVLLQMRQDTEIARYDSELRIRPILFIKDLTLNIDGDEVKSIDTTVVNAGLGPALNVRTELGDEIKLPGSGMSLKPDIFERSSIIQVLPNAASSAAGSTNANFYVSENSTVTLGGGISGIAEHVFESSSTLRIPLARRPDGQAQLRLHSLGVSKEELENAFKDALFITTGSSMTNKVVAYKNRPKRSGLSLKSLTVV